MDEFKIRKIENQDLYIVKVNGFQYVLPLDQVMYILAEGNKDNVLTFLKEKGV